MSTDTLASLDSQILDLDDERGALVRQRLGIDSELTSIAVSIRTNKQLPRDVFSRYLRRQDELKREANALLTRIQEINTQKKRLHVMRDQVWVSAKRDTGGEATTNDHDGAQDTAVRQALRDLHKKYSEFSADPTRVASMRRMASEFCIEILSVIKPR